MRYIDIDYDSLIEQRREILQYAASHCDRFSFITKLLPPYSKVYPRLEHDRALLPLRPYLIRQKFHIKKWAVMITKERHYVMQTYKLCHQSKILLLKMPNVFVLRDSSPEDICFYHRTRVWLATSTHEKFAYMCASQQDIEFLKRCHISFYG